MTLFFRGSDFVSFVKVILRWGLLMLWNINDFTKTVAAVTGSVETLEKIEKEQRHDLCCSTYVYTARVIKSTGMRWAGYVARIGGNRISNRAVIWKSEIKRQLERLGLRWDYNIKMGFKEIKLEAVDWIVLAQKRNQWLGV
jgi:hypothetical protein